MGNVTLTVGSDTADTLQVHGHPANKPNTQNILSQGL
jgi:hypothetical protein